MDDLLARREVWCLVAVALFSCSGALILQIPRSDRRTAFVFPAFLSLVVGGSLLFYGIYHFNPVKFAVVTAFPFVLVQIVRRVAPLWLMILASYVTLFIAVGFADFLLEASGFR